MPPYDIILSQSFTLPAIVFFPPSSRTIAHYSASTVNQGGSVSQVIGAVVDIQVNIGKIKLIKYIYHIYIYIYIYVYKYTIKWK